MTIHPTPSFWNEVQDAIQNGIRFWEIEDYPRIITEQAYAWAVRAAWDNLIDYKYKSQKRFDSLETFVNAAKSDRYIIDIYPRTDYPKEWLIQTPYNLWRANAIHNDDGKMILIDISVKESRGWWYGQFSECVTESLDIIKEIDALRPQFLAMIEQIRNETARESAIQAIEKTTSDAEQLPYEKRRTVIEGRFTYLVDDQNYTAWIKDGDISDEVSFTIPETVTLEGKDYRITSIEAGACFESKLLKELTIPDSIEHIDEDSFKGCRNLSSIHIGKGLKHYRRWSYADSPIEEVTIDKLNPYIMVSDDGNLILSKDGTKVLYAIGQSSTIVVPEGVTEIDEYAISCLDNLKEILLPTTLRKVRSMGISQNRNLKSIFLPSGVRNLESEALAENESLTTLDIPEDTHTVDEGIFSMNKGLKVLILRSKIQVRVTGTHCIMEDVKKSWFTYFEPSRCELFVPEEIVETYIADPMWASFKKISAIVEK